MRDYNRPIVQNRRRFLDMLGKAGIGSALLRASPLAAGLMATRHAHASGGVKRAVFVYASNGSPDGLWLPNGRNLNVATQAYEGLQSICNFREVFVVGSGHGTSRKAMGDVLWTRNWTGDTLDQQLASVIGTATPYPSYALGIQTDSNNLISRKSGDMIPAQDSPAAAYAQLFGGAPRTQDPGVVLAQRQAVMNVNRRALEQLESRLGTFERDLLQKHEASLQEIEERLVAASQVEQPEACSAPSWNAQNYPTQGPNSGNNGPFLHQAELHSDIITAAFTCGITNVFTLQLGYHQGEWYAHDTEFRGHLHNSCHAASDMENAEMINYQSRCIAYLVRKLLDTDDPLVPGTKLIDNTVVVQVTDMGNGMDHSPEDGPNMIATRMPGFRQGTVSSGGTHREVLETVAHGMGLSAYVGSDVDQHRIWPHGEGRIIDELLT